ncbi:protein MMS22-like [Haemaphysalis longicornis]
MTSVASYPHQPGRPRDRNVFEPTDADVGVMFDCTDRAVRVGASACNFSPDVPYVRLCGQLLCRDRLTHAQLTRLFWSARSKFMTLDVSQSFHRSTEAYKQHHEVSCLLAYIRHEVDRLADTGASKDGLDSFGRETADSMGPHDFCRCVVDELRQTLRMVGPCSGLPVADWNHCDSGDGHRFHLALEVWWTALHVVDVAMSFNLLRGLVVPFCDLGGFGQNGLFAQVAVLFMADLCRISSRQFVSLGLKSAMPVVEVGDGAFPCACVREAWAMLADLIGRRHEHFAEEGFWTYVNFVLEVVCPQSKPEPEMSLTGFCLSSFTASVERTERDAFCLWLLAAAAEARKKCVWGAKSNYLAARRFVTAAVTAESKERLMRVVVRSCIRLCGLWEPSLELVQPLLDFYLKHLDESFMIASCHFQAFQAACQTSQQIQVRARALAECDDLGVRGVESSYELFLMLLAKTLCKNTPEGATNAWKTLRGRICSRFHANRVEELTEVGLRNCSLLFLVLSLSIRQHPEEPVDRLLSVLALVPADSPVEKLQAALRSLFAVLLLLQTTSADLSAPAQKTAAWFFERCVGLAPQGGSQCQSLRTALLPVYTQGIRDVVDASSNLALSEQALLVPETSLLLEQCSTSQQEDIIVTIQEAAEKLRSIHKRSVARYAEGGSRDDRLFERHAAFSGAICRSTLQFLHKALALPVHAPAPPACFTDLAVSITLLALDLPPPQSGPVKASFVSLFDHFGCSPHTHPSASGRFLCLLLEDDQVSSEIETRAANAEARIVQSWLRCCVAVEPPCAEMTRLSRIVLSRKEFERYNALVGAVVPSKDDDLLTHDELAVHFLDCLAQYADIVSAMDGLSALSQLRQSVAFYLRDFATLVVAQLRSGTATSTRLANVYFLCGQLFRLCAGLLYTRGMADCLLPKLLDSLVLPSALYAGKLIPQAQLAAIKQHLPLFVCGLLTLSPQTDAYIERKLKDIVVHYLPMFPTQTQSSIHHTGEHPLLATLESCGGACRAAAERRAAYVGFLLDFIHKHFVARARVVSAAHLNQALRFLQELLKHTACRQGECKSVLEAKLPVLASSLGSLTLAHNRGLNRDVLAEVVRSMTARCKAFLEQKKVTGQSQ